MKLLRVEKSPNPDKRYRAVFKDHKTGKEKHTDFGDPNMDNYTIHKDKVRRDNYRSRHQKDLLTNDPTRAGYLSNFLLWGPSTSLETNIRLFKQKFNL